MVPHKLTGYPTSPLRNNFNPKIPKIDKPLNAEAVADGLGGLQSLLHVEVRRRLVKHEHVGVLQIFLEILN